MKMRSSVSLPSEVTFVCSALRLFMQWWDLPTRLEDDRAGTISIALSCDGELFVQKGFT